MTNTTYSFAVRTVVATVSGALLAACGGGSSVDSNATLSASIEATPVSASMEATSLAKIQAGRPTVNPTPPVKSPVATNPAAAITSVSLVNQAAVVQSNMPFTFGQVFAAGHLAKGMSLTGRLDNGETLQLQVDAKAFHPDGSVRHAVVSGVVPTIAANQVSKMTLAPATATTGPAATTAQLLGSGFTASVSATIGGQRYTASADELIKAGRTTTWLAGPTATEWHVSAPLKTASGLQHPHLTARFAIRWFDAAKKARVDVTVENAWAYEASPSNFIYDAEVLVGGKSVYAKPALEHYHHARWRKVFWMGSTEADSIDVKLDTAYLLGTGAVPNYDQSIVVKEATLALFKSNWTGAKTEPMGVGSANPYMPSTGGRDEIGLLPAWAATYLLSMDSRTKRVTLANGDLAGSWSIHYRDKLTDRPVSVVDYPYMTTLGKASDTRNPATGKREAFPECATGANCTTPYKHDTSHQASFAYVPYLVTGDYYYLEELQFWAMYNILSANPGYRETRKGLLHSNQVRGQAWGLRTLAHAAFITPDSDSLKSHFMGFMQNNLAWYNANYTDDVNANKFGVLINKAVVYNNGRGIAPWQDDFFTSVIGHSTELGFTEANRLLVWKAKFPVQRMSNNGLCWISGAIYSLNIRKSSTAPFFTDLKQAAAETQEASVQALACGSVAMANALKLKVGEMTGYSSAATGYPSNMQPALAYGAQISGETGKTAWATFMARTVKPNYSTAPQFAIVPR
ncbi:hypothetical protein [Massilia puerhi]|uniref:RIFT barrel domain-containing protein n=1 Tax=Massilia puerhi TaxID=2681550 RepID=UPI001E2E009F|nr:hypothetical protein [Massilia puerhi]